MTDGDPPAGFKPLFRTSPFLEHNGPFFYRETGDGTFVVGLRIQPKHANARGIAHGGILMPMGAVDAIEFLLDKLRSAKTNQDFFGSMNQ